MQYTHTKAQNLNRAFFSKRPEITLDVGKTMSDVEKIISDIIQTTSDLFCRSQTPETHIVPFKGLQQEITDVFVTWGMGKTLPEDESVERFPQQAACRLFP